MASYRLRTGFFAGVSGSIHVSLFLPHAGTPTRWVLHFPAFAEEMNKSRAMVARTARALAESGLAVVVPDPIGTGDSDGDFIDARWEDWLTDQLLFWGLRCGCLLAAEAASTMIVPPNLLLFWQPVHSGKQVMTWFLRLRMAASLGRSAGDGEPELREDVAGLRGKLLLEGSLRVAGYQLGAELYRAIESRQLNEISLPSKVSVAVLEVAGNAGQGGNRATLKQLEQWSQSGLRCILSSVPGDSFWATQELGVAPALTEATLVAIGRGQCLSGKEHFEPTALNPSSSEGVASLSFLCGDSRLVGELHSSPDEAHETAVVIVVGGPQYRVGSHRQFVLLARALARQGYPVLRFDYRGMGDSEGDFQGFKDIDQDIHCALDALQEALPAVRCVVLWGLCDAATASVCYAPSDRRVKGLVLVNPWVYSEVGSAKAYLRHYYWRRFLSGSFWAKVWSGDFRPVESLSAMVRLMKRSSIKWQRKGEHDRRTPSEQAGQSMPEPDTLQAPDLVQAFAQGLVGFSGPTLLLISDRDLTAAEFVDAGKRNPRLRKALASSLIRQENLLGVDHTFSRPEWRRRVEEHTLDFLCKL